MTDLSKTQNLQKTWKENTKGKPTNAERREKQKKKQKRQRQGAEKMSRPEKTRAESTRIGAAKPSQARHCTRRLSRSLDAQDAKVLHVRAMLPGCPKPRPPSCAGGVVSRMGMHPLTPPAACALKVLPRRSNVFQRTTESTIGMIRFLREMTMSFCNWP